MIEEVVSVDLAVHEKTDLHRNSLQEMKSEFPL